YDGWESAPGIAMNGEQTLGENIADIGGMACALEALGKTENTDYDAFFRAYARGWLKCTTRERAGSLAEIDEDSSSNLRVNRVLSNFQEFYDTYNIKEGDG
ncbi:M13 family peptidase, partial [Clostridium sp. SL.3.18]|nr:M13 family peptidase [Clostridium sp. SL.3.18]